MPCFCCCSFIFACFYDFICLHFIGDLMMAIGNPMEGEVLVPPSLDLSHIGLATPPKAPLLSGKVGPSEPG